MKWFVAAVLTTAAIIALFAQTGPINVVGGTVDLSSVLTKVATQSAGDNTTNAASTAFVTAATANMVTGPATNTDLFVPQWNGTNSRLLKDGLAVASANTASAIVQRDGSGNFAAGTVTAALSGNSTTATTLQTARAIYGNNFDGSAALTQIIGSAFGGTANGFTKFTGPATSEKTFTLPNASATLSYTVASGTSALGTSAISSATCATVVTTSATGTATTDVIQASFNGDPTAVTGYVPLITGMLTIIAYPTADNVNFKVCNNTSASITPGAITLNWRVAR